jgi:hypothetical protein
MAGSGKDFRKLMCVSLLQRFMLLVGRGRVRATLILSVRCARSDHVCLCLSTVLDPLTYDKATRNSHYRLISKNGRCTNRKSIAGLHYSAFFFHWTNLFLLW